MSKAVTPPASLRARVIVFVVVALALAALFARLGFWQLDRLVWRRALNAEVASHIAAAPVSVAELPRDSAAMRYRRVQLRGAFDYANEIVITQRIRGGSPGVNLLTPLRVDGSDTAYLVNRGWVSRCRHRGPRALARALRHGADARLRGDVRSRRGSHHVVRQPATRPPREPERDRGAHPLPGGAMVCGGHR